MCKGGTLEEEQGSCTYTKKEPNVERLCVGFCIRLVAGSSIKAGDPFFGFVVEGF